MRGWLEDKSYEIVGLEALREGPDIEAISPDGLRTAFEVKLIGDEDNDMKRLLKKRLLKSIAGKPSPDSVSPYDAMNYLAFRAYEAAVQLGSVGANRVIVLAVDVTAWWRFEPQLENRWIDFRQPKFFQQEASASGHEFIENQKNKYPNFPGDCAAAMREVDSIWIVTKSSDIQLELKYNLPIRGRRR